MGLNIKKILQTAVWGGGGSEPPPPPQKKKPVSAPAYRMLTVKSYRPIVSYRITEEIAYQYHKDLYSSLSQQSVVFIRLLEIKKTERTMITHFLYFGSVIFGSIISRRYQSQPELNRPIKYT